MEKRTKEREYLELYNESIKEQFLSTVEGSESSKDTFKKWMKSIGSYEKLLEKDLYLFNPDDVTNMFSYLNTSSANTATVMLSVIKKYKTWAMAEKYIPPFDEVMTLRRTDVMQSISKTRSKQQYIKDRNEFKNIIDFCVNFQDKALFIMLYYGIDGTKHEEMVNMLVEDIKENGIITRKDDGTERFVWIPKEYLECLEIATQEREYMKSNDMAEGAKAKSFDIITTPYVLRPAHNRAIKKDLKIDPQIINQRVKKIAVLYNAADKEQYPSKRNISRLNPQTILLSGIFHALKDVEDEKGKLEREDYEKILEQYNLQDRHWGNYKLKYEAFKEI